MTTYMFKSFPANRSCNINLAEIESSTIFSPLRSISAMQVSRSEKTARSSVFTQLTNPA